MASTPNLSDPSYSTSIPTPLRTSCTLIEVCSVYYGPIKKMVFDTYSSASADYINYFSSLPDSCAKYPGMVGTCIGPIPASIEDQSCLQ